MKTKYSPVPKWVPKEKPIPDDTVYLTPQGDRVKITKTKQFRVYPDEAECYQKLRRESNERYDVVRISDGHVMWGYEPKDLTPE